MSVKIHLYIVITIIFFFYFFCKAAHEDLDLLTLGH